MHIELSCPHCDCQFVHETDLYQPCDPDRLEAELFHEALGDGGTVEDALHAALDTEQIHCPDCETPVAVGEEDLGRLAMTMLASW
jgi:hypothetical protein